MHSDLIESIQSIFDSKEKALQHKGEHNAGHYLSKEYLKVCNLISASEHKHLFNIITHTKCSEIDGLDSFLKEQGFTTVEDRISGCFFYPENGFMGWHTNHTRNDWRIYIVKSIKGDSFFRYVKDNEIITEYDPIGWSYRIFYVGDETDPYWHCVYGGSGRYSIGFRLQKNKLVE
jgi:hypothetical protein